MSRDYHTRSRDHKADIMASAELSLLEAELTTALEQYIGAHSKNPKATGREAPLKRFSNQ